MVEMTDTFVIQNGETGGGEMVHLEAMAVAIRRMNGRLTAPGIRMNSPILHPSHRLDRAIRRQGPSER